MGDNKISEAVGAACSAFNATDGMLPSRMHAAIEAALPFILSVDTHLQSEAVPVGHVVHGDGCSRVRWAKDNGIFAIPDGGALYAHPQPAELNEVSGGSGEVDCPRADSLLREVCAQLDAVGCGACVGSMAPMEDLHGRIMQHLSYGSANEEQEIDDLTELLNQLSMRLPSKLMDRVSAALAATGKQQVGENPAWRDELVREAHARGLMEGLNSPRPQQVGEVQGLGVAGLPGSVITHRNAWRKALVIARDSAEVDPPEINDRAYWEHEIRAFDRTFDRLWSLIDGRDAGTGVK